MKKLISKNNLPLAIALTVQLFYFYIFPIFAGKDSPIGMVLAIICVTFFLSFLLGAFTKSNLKFLYPPLICVLFVPSIFIYYNTSALIHILWYFVISTLGLGLGLGLRFAIKSFNKPI